jgi:ribulose-phosphate 3-epimerase
MKLSASLYAANPLHLARSIAAVAPYVGSFHIDVMDGRFAPAFGCDERLVTCLMRESEIPIDMHLMICDPAVWAVRFAGLGVRSIAFHVESGADVETLADRIRREGALAYLALRHTTPVETVAAMFGSVDGVLLLSAPAGGGRFDTNAFERLARLPKGLPSVVDGNVDQTHFDRLRREQVDVAVIGKALFSHADIARQAQFLATAAASRSAVGF